MLATELLGELDAALTDYEATIAQASAGKRAHVGARADIAAVMREIMELVAQLDAINIHRFRADAELKAAWRSARDLPWRRAGRGEPATDSESIAPAA